MTVPDPNSASTEGDLYLTNEVIDKVRGLIENCIQMYMDRDETARTIEAQAAIDRRITHMVWDGMAALNQEFFRNYYIRLVLMRQIVTFNQLLEQQHRAMNSPPVPADDQISMELPETAPQNNSPESEMNYENEAESDKLPATAVGSVGSEEVAGSDQQPVIGGSLTRSSLVAQGMRINAAPDAAHMPISQVLSLTTGGLHSANSGGPLQPSNSLARSLSHLDIEAAASVQENRPNSASSQDSPSADL